MTETSLLFVLLGIALFALFSGPIGRGNLTPPMVFTLLGLAMSPVGVGWIDLSLDNRVVHLVAEITLILVLFTDASRINVRDLMRHHDAPVRMLVIGMPLTIAVGAVAAVVLLPELSLLGALVLAVILAPTDAALGQAVVSSPDVPGRIRQALNVESGLNDGIALPALLFVISFAGAHGVADDTNWLTFVLQQITLGPVVGVATGWLGAKAINAAIDRRFLSHQFCNIYLLSLAFIAFLAAELIGGNGFIAAFVGGIAVGNTLRRANEEIYEFAESEGQLLNLVIFFVFGAVMLPQVWDRIDAAVLAYALCSLTLVRMLPVYLSLIGKRLRWETMTFLGWFGPRGLASILFVLLVLEQAELPHQPLIFDTVMLTVALSVFLHGLSALPGVRLYKAALRTCERRGDDLSSEMKPVVAMPLRLSMGKASPSDSRQSDSESL